MKVDRNVFTRNRRQLISMNHQPSREIPDIEEPLNITSNNSEGTQDLPSDADTSHKSSSGIEHTVASPKVSPQLCRSGRNRRPPDWITNYVPS